MPNDLVPDDLQPNDEYQAEVERQRQERFGGDLVFEIRTPCVTCVHLQDDPTRWVCDAFPQGIPQMFIDGDNKHRKPVKGDHGIQYFPKRS